MADIGTPTPPAAAVPSSLDLYEMQSQDEAAQAGIRAGSYDQEARDMIASQQQQFSQYKEQVDPLQKILANPFQGAPPKYQMNDLLKSTPLWMTMAAMLGSGGRHMGTVGINAINGMVDGLTKGDEEQYKNAEKQYDENRKSWDEYSRHISLIVNELTKAYGSDSMATLRAAQAALRAKGEEEKRADVARNRVIQIQKLRESMDKAEKDRAEKYARDAEQVRHHHETEAAEATKIEQKGRDYDAKITAADAKNVDSIAKEITAADKALMAPYANKKVPPAVQKEHELYMEKLKKLTEKRMSGLPGEHGLPTVPPVRTSEAPTTKPVPGQMYNGKKVLAVGTYAGENGPQTVVKYENGEIELAGPAQAQ